MILENNTAKLNDIVFANRNKSYGAYAIRSAYDNTIIKSLAITGLIFASISMLAISLNKTTPAEVKLDAGTNIINDSTIYSEREINVTPLKHEAVPAEKPVIAPQTEAVSTVIKDVTTEQKKDIIQTIESPTSTEGEKGNIDENGATTQQGNQPGTDESLLSNSKSAEPSMAPDVMPSFNIGPFLKKNLKYPTMALEANVSGRVVINFIVDEDGTILKSSIINSVGYGCDEEALRVIRLMPKWTPGRSNGKPVKVSFNQVIIFRLQ